MHRVKQIGQTFYPQYRFLFVWHYYTLARESAYSWVGFPSLAEAWAYVDDREKTEPVRLHYRERQIYGV